MKRTRKTFLFLLIVTAILCFSMTASAAAKAKKVKLNKKKITLTIGKTFKLKATVKPSSANKKVKWKSSNKKVAAVNSKGVVKAKKAGKATITCTLKKNPKIKATCKVTVKKKKTTASSSSGSDPGKDSGTGTGSNTGTDSGKDTDAGQSSGGTPGDDPKEDPVTFTDSAELEDAKFIIAKTSDPLYQWKHNTKPMSKYSGSNLPIWIVNTTANGVMKAVKVYDENGKMKGYTYCNQWGGPSVTYAKEVQAGNTALKDGSYDFASDPSGLLVGWAVWDADTVIADFEKMINNDITPDVFGLVKDTMWDTYTFSIQGGGATIIIYGRNSKGKLIGKYAGVMSYNMYSNAIYFRVKGINPENTEDYGKNFYSTITW